MKRGSRTAPRRGVTEPKRAAAPPAQRGAPARGRRRAAVPEKAPAPAEPDTGAVLEFFGQLSNAAKTQIESDGIVKLCEGLGIDPAADVAVLLIVWKCECRSYGIITKDEFLRGMDALHADSMNSLKNRLSTLREVQQDPSSKDFQRFFKFVFTFCNEPPATVMEMETAAVMMPMLLQGVFPLTEKFVNFCKDVQALKAMNADQWTSWLEACKSTNGDFINNYDEDGAWPLIIDEFYYWLKEGN